MQRSVLDRILRLSLDTDREPSATVGASIDTWAQLRRPLLQYCDFFQAAVTLSELRGGQSVTDIGPRNLTPQDIPEEATHKA